MKKIGLFMAMGALLLATVAEAGTIRLRFASYFPTASAQSKLLEEFCTTVGERTNGRVKIDFFGGGSLLKATKVYDGVVQGIADIGFSHIEYTVGRFPLTEILDLPLGYPSAWVGSHVANEFYLRFRPKEWNKVHVLWFVACTPNQLLLRNKPVHRLEDLRGLTIRGPGRIGQVVEALGGTAKPVPMNEAYEALARGVVDGVLISLEVLRSFRLADVIKYVTLCSEATNFYTFYVVMNKEVWNKLPTDIKVIMERTSAEFGERMALLWNMADFLGVEDAKRKGVKFISLPPEELNRWKQAVRPVVDNYLKLLEEKGYKREKLEGMVSFIRERINYWTKKQIEWRIKSATGPKEMREAF
ncbi:MAG: C4-dicarboxylate ABC transporter substrate-binding protein [Deltaproteobacteria bacterium]|nr:MAG: C4-dicarboxylate ABC transporter substrate-binding protein [Deltaproteobacteria bacterium]RLB02018.1 MAG: C4-dicarboxylate ABC transporter substrate-binding protein [Deltaproteobacteria bacterium]